MSDTAVSLLTAPGTGAIATVEVRGPRAWELARHLFKPAGKPLPESPELHRFWFGTLGSDEVILSVTSHDTIEVHCHGGRRVVRWVMDQFLASGGRQPSECVATQLSCDSLGGLTPPARLLEQAPTLRTASIILDQLNGAFANEVRRILALVETDPVEARDPLHRLAALGNTVGRHLVEPWKVVIAGPPNVGKSSLVNALAGYKRSVVSEVAGTTRDAVSVRVAFDGWPVELIDTAGMRDAEGLEAEGIERAHQALTDADLGVWVIDASVSDPVFPTITSGVVEGLLSTRWVWAKNKSDRSLWPGDFPVAALAISALTGEGISALATRVVNRLVPDPPSQGAAVPFTSRSIALTEAARSAVYFEKPHEAVWFLGEALAVAEAHTAGPSGLPSKP